MGVAGGIAHAARSIQPASGHPSPYTTTEMGCWILNGPSVQLNAACSGNHYWNVSLPIDASGPLTINPTQNASIPSGTTLCIKMYTYNTNGTLYQMTSDACPNGSLSVGVPANGTALVNLRMNDNGQSTGPTFNAIYY